jgi:hypothetical protein
MDCREFKGMAATLEKEARNCGRLFVDPNGLYYSDVMDLCSPPKAMEEYALQSLTDLLGLSKEEEQ